MAIRLPHCAKPADPDQKAAAFIAGSTKGPAVEPAESVKVVVNLRFDAARLAKVDASAKRQGITRTAWLHRAAYDALAE
jgi:hypothetical protein